MAGANTYNSDSPRNQPGGHYDDESNQDFTTSVNDISDSSEDDYYSFLSLSRNATSEEITNQYRKFSRIFHPDKHCDPEKKAQADVLFAKAKKVYEVLSDPQKRAIYDTVGVKGLETEGWEIVQRYKTAQEIREEYERLAREKEERELERRTNPKGSVTVNINASEIFTVYDTDLEDEEDFYYDVGPYVELTGFHFNQSIEAPLTTNDTLLLSGNVSAENGRGKGQISLGLKKNLSNRAWGEAEIGGSTNGLDFGLKGYTQFGRRFFSNFNVACQSTPDGLRPGMIAVIGNQFDSNSVGTLTWRSGGLSGLQTSYIYENSITRLVGSVHFGVPHSFASISACYKHENKRFRTAAKVGTFGAFFEYGVEKKVSHVTSFGASMLVGVPMGVTLRIKVSRANQMYNFPIQLCDQILPAPVFYGTITPCIIWLVVNKLFIEPQEEDRKKKEKEKLKESYRAKMAEKKREAESAIQLMTETYSRIKAEEERRGGLVIVAAKYGRLVLEATPTNTTVSSETGEAIRNEEFHSDEFIDVTIPLQCLVKDSKLILHDASKSQLPGFYDPSPAEDKNLIIKYKFRNEAHEVVLRDNEAVKIPKYTHKVPSL